MVSSESVRIGGNKLDAAIMEYVRRKYGLAIGERTAEEVKINIGSAMYLENKLTMEVKGRDMVSGLPRIIVLSSDDITEAVQEDLAGLISALKEVLYDTPPELSADIMDKGMVLSGGSSQLRNIEILFSKAVGVAAFVADDPILCVVRGAGIALENLESYKRSILATR